VTFGELLEPNSLTALECIFYHPTNNMVRDAHAKKWHEQ